jgi:hypothetical protein
MMNEKGNPDTLSSAHPGNINAMKSGVYSIRARDQLADNWMQKLQSVTYGELLSEIATHELASMLALGDLLDADIAQNGISNRRGEQRRQVGSRMRIYDRLARWAQRVARDPELGQGHHLDQSAVHEFEDGELEWDRYQALRGLALAERPGVSPSVQVRAIAQFLEAVVPHPPGSLNGRRNVIGTEGHDHQSEPDSSAASLSLGEEREHDRERCMDILHGIATRRRADASPKDQLAAMKLLHKLAPPDDALVWERLAEDFFSGMSEDEIAAEMVYLDELLARCEPESKQHVDQDSPP